ncbi:MAG: hypothetical protein ABEI75_00980 [Halobaculum sp.]
MATRRELVLAASGATAALSGCLGVFGGTDDGSSGRRPDVRLSNGAGESVTVRLELTRPVGWTPTGTATRTSDGIVTAATREVTVDAESTRRLTDVFPGPGRFAVTATTVPQTESEPYGDEDNRRFDAGTLDAPVEVGVWYLEDSPHYDGIEVTEPETYFHVLLGDPSLSPG